jgi:hypothetical protein
MCPRKTFFFTIPSSRRSVNPHVMVDANAVDRVGSVKSHRGIGNRYSTPSRPIPSICSCDVTEVLPKIRGFCSTWPIDVTGCLIDEISDLVLRLIDMLHHDTVIPTSCQDAYYKIRGIQSDSLCIAKSLGKRR